MSFDNFVIMDAGALPVLRIFTKIEKVSSDDDILDKRYLGKWQKSACCSVGGGWHQNGAKIPLLVWNRRIANLCYIKGYFYVCF